ncbi:MAG: transposase [Candidatus Gribaldobacteria bacterium]|nr:transposase [Candidatus Gribaldobacteria bacterium]
MRDINFVNGEYYHIYNRGVDKREVFLDKKDYWKFFDGMRDFNNSTYYQDRLGALGLSTHSIRELHSSDFKQLGSFLAEQGKVVDIISYTLNPNHPHLIIRQLKDRGISNFMHKLGTSYTNYFNKKYDRSGALFQGAYKIIHINNNEYLLWLIGYINGNIEIHGLEKASDYPWSSYRAIWNELGSLHKSGNEPSSLQNSLSKLSVLSGLNIILEQFKNEKEFIDFVSQVIEESKTKKEMKKYLLED